ncbi:hypothetical protein FSOLCH5_002693 [Fusarium solani]
MHGACSTGSFLSWHLNFQVMQQAMARLNRIGQREPVDWWLLKVKGLLRRGLFAAASMSCPAYPTTASLSLHGRLLGRLLDDSTGVDYLVDKYMSAQLEMDEIMLKSAAFRSGEMLKSIDIQPCVTLLPRDSDRYTPELGFPFPDSVISENNQWLQSLVFFAMHPSTVDEPSLTLPAKCRSWWQDQV